MIMASCNSSESSQIYEINIHQQDHHRSLYLEKRFHNIPKNNERSDNKF